MADNPPSQMSESQLNDSLREKLREVPSHISESQKLLKTSIFQTPQPQFPTKCLILNIYKIQHQHLEVRVNSYFYALTSLKVANSTEKFKPKILDIS